IWEQEQKVPKHKIFRFEDKDNFWQMGESGPCGFCTEIHYFNGKETQPQPEQLTEIWNLVFMEFYDKENGKREKLSIPCVDTGMGLERLCAVLQNKKSNYHTDLFSGIIQSLELASGCQYDFDEKNQTEQQKAFRVLADHSRAICFLIADDVIPGNEKENYVLRRIIRRALYYSQKLHPEKNLLQVAVNQTLSLMSEVGDLLNQDENMAPAGKAYFALEGEQKRIQSIIESETKKFFNSLKEGKKQLEKIMKSHSVLNELNDKIPDPPAKKQPAPNKEKEQPPAKDKTKQLKKAGNTQFKPYLKESEVWNLYSTYGFPTDLTRLIAKEKGWTAPSEAEMKQYIQENIIDSMNQKAKETYLTEQNRLQKEARLDLPIDIKNRKNLIANRGLKNFLQQHAPSYLLPVVKNKIEKTNFTGYEKDQETGKIVFTGLLRLPKNTKPNENQLQSLSTVLEEDMEDWLVLDKTCFYPEGGGPVGDKGWLETETGQAQVLDCQEYENYIWQKIKVLKGELKENQKCKMAVYKNYRRGIKSHHTATHLLNSALRQTLGHSVRQKGSLIEPYFLRFDFTHPQALNQKQRAEVEKKILEHISQKEEVTPSYKAFEQAQKEGYIYLKGENYPSQVRVLKIGQDSSKELCGGVHVKNTSEIESFKIIKEEGVGSGVRRITAYANFSLKAWENFLIKQNLALRQFLILPQNNSFKKEADNGTKLWIGKIEKENLFLKTVEQKEKELKLLRKKIVILDTKQSETQPQQKDTSSTVNS
ncbi:MAG: alanine--tRNA ligase-related protein, partial [Oligoflexia bacterium]|nr:alanine--tRNA ligase-related protein [Oligoflexia bacterium]